MQKYADPEYNLRAMGEIRDNFLVAATLCLVAVMRARAPNLRTCLPAALTIS